MNPKCLNSTSPGADSPKPGHADHRAVEPHVLPPTVHGGSFDRHARTHGAGQHVFLVFGRLRVKKLGAGHGNHARLTALPGQRFGGGNGELHFGTRSDEDYLGCAFAILEDIRAALHGFKLFLRAGLRASGPDGSTPYRKAGRTQEPPSTPRRVSTGVAGTPHEQIGNKAQAAHMLDGLVRGAVLSDADGIVRQYPDKALLHERGQADGVLA